MTPKTITAKIVVPEWAKWVATDSNGRLFAYKTRPVNHPKYGIWVNDPAIKSEHTKLREVCTTTPPRNWRKTLRRVK